MARENRVRRDEVCVFGLLSLEFVLASVGDEKCDGVSRYRTIRGFWINLLPQGFGISMVACSVISVGLNRCWIGFIDHGLVDYTGGEGEMEVENNGSLVLYFSNWLRGAAISDEDIACG